jgi:hypothetical protein
MITDAIGIPRDGLAGRADSELVLELGELQRAAIKRYLLPGEYVVWAGRGIPRPLPSIPVFPSFFAAFLCGFSGFALMVLFGIYGVRKMGLGETLFLLCLAPAALGCVTATGLAWSSARHRLWQSRIARSFYVLTDRRAISGLMRREGRAIALFPWTADLFDGTRCIEHGDGIGAVYCLRHGEVVEPQWGFEGIRQAGRVEALIRQILLGEKPPSGSDLQEL